MAGGRETGPRRKEIEKMGYDNPEYQIRRTACYETAAGNGAVGAKFASFQKLRLKAAHAIVTTAGTSAGHTLTIKNGTTALGTMTLGTSAAGVTASVTGLDSTVESLAQLTATNGTDATGKALVVYEYEVHPDTTES
jgi:hypothetical protein